ncbi:MAG TPA: hypothetical protein VGJ16_06105, partial [Pirellulales bacterium]
AVPGDKLPSSSEVLGRDTGQSVEAAKTGRTDASPLHDDRPSLLASAASFSLAHSLNISLGALSLYAVTVEVAVQSNT